MNSSVKIFFILFLITVLFNETQSRRFSFRLFDCFIWPWNCFQRGSVSNGPSNERTTDGGNEVRPEEILGEDISDLYDFCGEMCDSKKKLKCENIIKELRSNFSTLNQGMANICKETKNIWRRLTQNISSSNGIKQTISELNETMNQNSNRTFDSLNILRETIESLEVLHNSSLSIDSRLNELASDLSSNLTTISNRLESMEKASVNHTQFTVWVQEKMTEIQAGTKILKELRSQHSSESRIYLPIKTEMIDGLTKSDLIAAIAVITMIQFVTFGALTWYLNSKYNLSSVQKSDPNYDSISRARNIDTKSINSPYTEVGGIKPESEYATVNKNRPCTSLSNEMKA